MTSFAIGPALIARDARRTYRVPQLPGFELDLAPMTPANKPFWSDVLATAETIAAASATSNPFSDAELSRGRRADAQVMARHVLVGWRGVTDVSGAEVPFNQDAALRFLLELATTDGAEHIFDGIRAFAKDNGNFTNASVATAKALAGNSSGG